MKILCFLNNLIKRQFASRWLTAARRGLGLVLGLAVLLLCSSFSWAWVEDYSNTHGGIAEWTESYDSAGKFALTQSSTSHRITASSSMSEVWGGYRLDISDTWGDCIFRIEIYDQATYPRSMKDHIGLRVQDTGSFPTNGFYFYCTGTVVPMYQGGYWQPTGCTWGSNTNYASATVYGRYDFRVVGTGWDTVVTIFGPTGQTLSAFTNPSLSFSTGKVAHGYSTLNFYSGYDQCSNIYVYDLAVPTATPTFTNTATPTVTPTPTVVSNENIPYKNKLYPKSCDWKY